jgi:hypothetical protein
VRLAVATPVLAACAAASCARHAAEREPQFLPARDVSGLAADVVGAPDKALHPMVSYPKYASDREAGDFVADDDRVFFIRTREVTLVYPEVVLSLHHVINEKVEGEPVAVTQCRLTDSAVLYSRRLDGETITLGSEGTVLYGNSVLYDRETDSIWTQLTGECIGGRHAQKRLVALGTLESGRWGDVKGLPYVNVAMPQAEIARYRSYHDQIRSSDAGLKALESRKAADGRLPPRTSGLGIAVRGEARFYPLDAVKERGAIQDEVGGWGILVVHDERFGGSRILRTFLDGARLTFQRSGLSLRDLETGSTWTLEGEAIGGKLQGKALERPAYAPAYWFAWAAFHPGTGIFPAGPGGAAGGGAEGNKDGKEGTR